jgi:peptidyl-prolyl cis-trans isomerase D
MLQFMRKQRSKLKWVLIVIIIVLAAGMVVGLTPFGDVGSIAVTDDVARVGAETITALEFANAYQSQVQRVLQQNQSISPEMLKLFGFDRQVLQDLISLKVILAEARRLGLDVSDVELQQNILSNPAFLAGGSFIGVERYEALLQANNLSAETFEESLRMQLATNKVQSFVTAGVAVSDKEAEEEYRRRNEKAALTYFVLDPVKMESRVPALSDQELREYFEKNKARYDIPEKRNSRYAFADKVKYRAELTATDQELEEYYLQHSEEYRLPAQVTAQHILFKTEGKTPEQVEEIRKKATDVLTRAKNGEDFARLARQFSEDSSAAQGGNLGTFGRGAMVPEFEQAAFNMEAGAISDLVTTQYGFHIIKVNEKREDRLRPFTEIKEAIRPVVLFNKGRERANQVAEQVALDLVSTKDLNAAASKNGVAVMETGLLEQGETIPGFGSFSPAYQSRVFTMMKDELGTAIEVENGFVVPQVIEIQEKHPATFEEARTKVLQDARSEKAREMVTENTNRIREQIEAGKANLSALAAAFGAEVKTSEKLTRGGSIPEFGSIAERDAEIFSLPVGQPAPPVTFSGKTLVFSVKSRDEVNPEEMKKALPGLREEMLPAKKQQYFEAYIGELQNKMVADGEISINETALAQIVSATQ